MRTICIIPARCGSKRCPGKNVKPFADKSLSIIAMEQALRLKKRFSSIILTTDDPIAIEQAKAYNPEIKIRRRPDELCSDSASSESAIEDAISWSGWDGDFVYLSEVTSPLRSDDDVIKSLELAEIYGKGVKSVCEIKNCITDEIVEPKQQLNGAIHIWVANNIRDIPYTNFVFYDMPVERSIHIDYDFEFEIAEMLYRRQHGDKKNYM